MIGSTLGPARTAALLVLVPLSLALSASAWATPRTALPKRIISLSPTATEDLFAIGAGHQVVAVDNQSNYPAKAPRTKLSGITPNVEAIAGYKPDLVVVSYDSNHIVEALAELGVKVLVQPTAPTLGDAYAQIAQLGRATGHPAAAGRVVSAMKRRITTAVASVHRTGTPVSIYEELEPDLYSPTSKTFIGRIYAMFGLKNIADAADKSGTGYPQLSEEYVVAANPQLIVLADTVCCGQTVAKLKARPGWDTIAAVSKGNVLAVNDDVASRWGPRVVDFVGLVAAKLRELSAR